MSEAWAQRAAVAKLVGVCEGLCNSGVIAGPVEETVRRHVAEALAAFHMPSRAEIAAQDRVISEALR